MVNGHKLSRPRIPIHVKASTLAKHPSAARKKTAFAPRIRPSITPGTIAILLAGPYAGRRVVCLKALESGFIAVTGPYEWNRVPLRRAHQKFIIATSTKIDLTDLDTSQLVDSYFKKERKPAPVKDDITEQPTRMKKIVSVRSDSMKAHQKVLDKVVMQAAEKASPLIRQYLKTRFSLGNFFGLKAHELKF